MRYKTLFQFSLSLCIACSFRSNAQITLYLLGDAGKPSNIVLEQVALDVRNTPGEKHILFLGDNVYPTGMGQSNKGRDRSTEILMRQVDFIKDSKNCHIYFVPGNHDWRNGRIGGHSRIKRQYEFITGLELKNISFFPKNGQLGPARKRIKNGSLDLIFIDSQWFLQSKIPGKIGINKSINQQDDEYFWDQLRRFTIEAKESNNVLLIAMHHPFYTIGGHGKNKWFVKLWSYYIPVLQIPAIPTFGNYSPYNLLVQDITHSKYDDLRIKIMDTLNTYYPSAPIIFAAGHEHNLQYWKKNNVNHIVSGAASKTNKYIKKLTKAKQNNGARLIFPSKESVFLEKKKMKSAPGFFKIITGSPYEIEAHYILQDSDKWEIEKFKLTH